jgi:hypothetical protein
MAECEIAVNPRRSTALDTRGRSRNLGLCNLKSRRRQFDSVLGHHRLQEGSVARPTASFSPACGGVRPIPHSMPALRAREICSTYSANRTDSPSSRDSQPSLPSPDPAFVLAVSRYDGGQNTRGVTRCNRRPQHFVDIDDYYNVCRSRQGTDSTRDDQGLTAFEILEQTFVQQPANSDLIFDLARVHDDLSS